MKNTSKNKCYTQAILFCVFISSCNGQSKTPENKLDEITTLPFATENFQAADFPEIQIDSARQTRLSFSSVNGHFDKVYGNVHNGFQDKSGNIWFGTTGAEAVFYDGNYFHHITTKDKRDNTITPLLADEQGNIWLGITGGLYRYDGKTFFKISIPNSTNSAIQAVTKNASSKSMPISFISALQDRDGNIWFGTETDGVYRYDGKDFLNITEQKDIVNENKLRLNTITNILEDKKGNIWLASWSNEGLCCYDGKSLINYTPKNGLGDDMIYSLSEDKTGNIWIGTRDHGVWRYDGKSFANISAKTDLKDESIYAIAQDKSGSIWFGSQSKGVWHYDGVSLKNFTTKDGLSNNSVFCIVTEKSGNVWFGTRGLGLCVYDGKVFKNFTKE